jgi:hypothetical protein
MTCTQTPRRKGFKAGDFDLEPAICDLIDGGHTNLRVEIREKRKKLPTAAAFLAHELVDGRHTEPDKIRAVRLKFKPNSLLSSLISRLPGVPMARRDKIAARRCAAESNHQARLLHHPAMIPPKKEAADL